ncbi:putative lipoprotein [Burkholderia multivorans ATCC BAA-247]|uniref:Putative lipoprotein n=1 Tax=Burkholderia multivorans CGD2 TaxID=513052 RepID=B9BPA7_9BURK|nr:putative lipoprotein [Burkholderia multivorans CGD2]EEE13796.1 putative lipoprotein [Burkholderia multivorans CGD2M]EJO51863.1 putative lipoprotein [Burkholderia multivorans CF2]EJO59077.1 putative lipoprotein [Burkholderia multivorans ATCC BAA-247]
MRRASSGCAVCHAVLTCMSSVVSCRAARGRRRPQRDVGQSVVRQKREDE